jgi:hypothetical protein
MAPEGREYSDIRVDPQRIVAPMARSDHPAVEIQDA